MKISNHKSQISKGCLKFGIGYLILAFVLLGLVYTTVTPIFEAPDEPWHFNYVRYVAEGRGLPSLRDNASGAYQEVGQPPLYYLVAGWIVAPVGEFSTQGLALHNPGFGYQAPGTVNDNKNLFAHTGREAFPWQGALLAIHLARLVSLAFGALTVLATWGLARQVFPDLPFAAWSAAAVVAFTPQFVFISSVTSNDSSAAALATMTLWAIARMIRQGVTVGRAAWAGVLVGLASLTKTSTILLGVFAAAVILLGPQTTPYGQRSAVIRRWTALAVSVLAALIVGGWWYARNGILYGDPLGLSVHLGTPWARAEPVSLLQVLSTLPLAFRSFWGTFGWGHVEMSPVIYVALGAAMMASVAGWVAGRQSPLVTQRGQSSIVISLLWCGAIFVSFLRWNQQVEAPHGRLLFPMIGALAVLLVGGWAQLPRPRVVLGGIMTGLLGLALVAPFAYIRPAYAWPEFYPLEQLAHGAVDWRYGDQARLVAFDLDRDSVSPGQWLNVRLCWVALRPMTRNYTVFVHVLGRENLIVGARDTWPGLGRFPTSLWPVGRAFCDTIPVRIETWAPTPEVYAVEAGLYDAATNERLETRDENGAPVIPPIGSQVQIVPPSPVRVSPQHTANADFGPIVLIGFDAPKQASPGQTVPVRLYWRAMTPMREDYTVFVHLLDASGKLVAQADAMPRGGAYPTSAWRVSVIPDEHTLNLPVGLSPGDYTIRVGLYLAPAGPRLPLGPSGDAFTLGVLQVR